eukprot:INCI19633.2.p1 GENE.INCI19633.2~~INCI19633.2.p1  ORF type:complete len:486 (+),score=67.48 INCI19633.2:74-1459(+)
MPDSVVGDSDRDAASSGRTLSRKNILRDAKESRQGPKSSEARDPVQLDSSRATSPPSKSTSTASSRSAGSDEDATSGNGSAVRSEASTPSITQPREVKMKRNCEACTVAKVKCSGRKPCKRCQARGEGVACIFLPKRSRWDPPNRRGQRKGSRASQGKSKRIRKSTADSWNALPPTLRPDGTDAEQFVAQNFTSEGAAQRREQMDFFRHQQLGNTGHPSAMTPAATHTAPVKQSRAAQAHLGPVRQSNDAVQRTQPRPANQPVNPPSSHTWSSPTPCAEPLHAHSMHVQSFLTANTVLCKSIQYEAALQVSDPRLKKNITALPDCSSKLMNVEPVQFTWKRSGQPAIGFLADDIQRELPDCVREDESGTKMVDESALVAVVCQGLQKNDRKIQLLESQLKWMRIFVVILAGLCLMVCLSALSPFLAMSNVSTTKPPAPAPDSEVSIDLDVATPSAPQRDSL